MMTIAKFTDWIISRWDGRQPAQQDAASALRAIMRKLRDESGSDDFAFDADWETLALAADAALERQPFSMIAALGLSGEVGEVMELLKKHARDGKHPGGALLLELGDVLHYLTVIAAEYGWTLDDVAAANVAKLIERDERTGRVT